MSQKTVSEVKTALTTAGFTDDEVKSFTIVPNNDLFWAVLKEDFAAVLPTQNVKGLDELENIILTLTEKDGMTQSYCVAKHLVDGLWARARSIEYSKQTKAARTAQLKAEKAAEDRRKFDKMIAENPSFLKPENAEQLLGLQRSYGVIDQATYELLLGQTRNLSKLVEEAQAAAKEQVLAQAQAQGQHKKTA